MAKTEKFTLVMIYFDQAPLKLMESYLLGYFDEKCFTRYPDSKTTFLQGISVDIFSQSTFLGVKWLVLHYPVCSPGMQKFFLLGPKGSIHVQKSKQQWGFKFKPKLIGLWTQPAKQRLYGNFLLWARSCHNSAFLPGVILLQHLQGHSRVKEWSPGLVKTKCYAKFFQLKVLSCSLFGSRK